MTMRKTLMTGLLVAGMAVAAGALAQGGPGGGAAGGPGYGMGRMGGGMGSGMGLGCAGNVQQRADVLKAELGITGEQDTAWAAYAKVLNDGAKTMQADRAGMDPAKIHAMPLDQRRAFMTQRMERHDQLFTQLKAAAEALLPSLSEYQKGKASAILPGLVNGGGMMGRGMGMGGPMMSR